VTGLALESALWCRYCYGSTESGSVIEPNDPNWDRLIEASRAAKEDPMAWLKMEDIYGNVASSPVFRRRFAHMLEELWNKGVIAILTKYLEGEYEG
jgi:mannitol 2-dehydrogenase